MAAEHSMRSSDMSGAKSISNSFKRNGWDLVSLKISLDAEVLNVSEEALCQCNLIVSGNFVNVFVLYKEVISLPYQVQWKLKTLVLTHSTVFRNERSSCGFIVPCR
jgi:hypothetical protein